MARYRRQEDEDEVVEATQEQEQKVESSEEETFKKRYGDLRRYMQQTVEQKDKELEDLRKKVQQTKKEEFKLPTSEEEIEAWASKYPEVAKIVDSIAQKRAREASSEVENSMTDLRKMKRQLEKEKAEHQLRTMHTDFDVIRTDKKFHAWVKEQPAYIQDALYKNETDAIAAARAIDLYKADMGMIAEKRSDSQLQKDAAKAVSRSSKGNPTGSSSAQWSESRVMSLKPHEYEKYEEEILKAVRDNKFVYDLNGGAR
jgi:hypothetical protein